MRRVIFLFYFIFLRTSAGGRGRGGAARFFFFFFFSLCSADHERDWPPCKVVFFGLATNALNVRNNKQQQHRATDKVQESKRGYFPLYAAERGYRKSCRAAIVDTALITEQPPILDMKEMPGPEA